MAPTNPYEKMRENSIMTTPKEELTLMLYNGALKFINQAIVAVEAKEYIKAGDLIIKVQNIIREFQISLKLEYDISKYYVQMYEYIYGLLVDANVKKEVKILEEARDLIRDLRDLWKEAMVASKVKGAK